MTLYGSSWICHQRVQAQLDFNSIRDTVAISIRIQGIGSQTNLFAVSQSIAIGIRIQRIGATLDFFAVGNT